MEHEDVPNLERRRPTIQRLLERLVQFVITKDLFMLYYICENGE